jgi:hypothetical protein
MGDRVWLLAGLPAAPTPQQADEATARSEIIRSTLAAAAGLVERSR